MATNGRLGFVVGVGIMLSGCSAAHAPTVSQNEIQQERERLAAQAKAYAEQQQARVQRVGTTLLARIPNAPQIEFTVIPGEAQINAGTDGQKIIITSGMLQFVRSDDELAAVLGHEIAHVTQGHVTKARMRSVLVAVAAVAAEAAAPGTGRGVAGLGQGFSNHFNQRQELEADAVGLQFIANAGYNPQVGVGFWERWAVELPQTLTANFFASHPSSPERSVSARKAVATMRPVSGEYAPTGYVAPANYPAQSVVTPVTAIPTSVPQQQGDPLLELDQLWQQGQITPEEYWRQRDTIIPPARSVPPPRPQPAAGYQQSVPLATEIIVPPIAPMPTTYQAPARDPMRVLLDDYNSGRITLEEYMRRREALEGRE